MSSIVGRTALTRHARKLAAVLAAVAALAAFAPSFTGTAHAQQGCYWSWFNRTFYQHGDGAWDWSGTNYYTCYDGKWVQTAHR
ncbi:hypothetical protein [Nonomuraea sp. GTA35]|uniref:hypothetical protein n=1 Tax=Nonomuraea sp. GTA35 TaxID=1676746 RepID=UPI0035C0EA20